MKALASLLCLLATGTLAQAGAEAARSSRYADLEATYASGFYEPVRKAALAITYNNDGTPYSVTLSVDGRKLTARVWQYRTGFCGDRITARLSVPNERMATDLALADYTNARCRLYVNHKWKATVSTKEADGSESRLEMEGDPTN